jgi:very-short-patch-repair endonuclease
MGGNVAGLAARQHGVVSRRQLVDLGLASSTIDRWVERGHLHRIHRGVYAVGHRRLTQEGIWLAAVLACPLGSVLSHGPAGQLQGIVPKRERLALHVSVPARSDVKPKGVITHRPRNLGPEDKTTRLWIPTTTATRTIFDLSATLPSLQLRKAFERAERLHLLERPRLSSLLKSSPSRKGSGLLRTLLSTRPPPLAEIRTLLEELIWDACSEHSLPPPLVNVPLLDYTVDFLWPEARLVVEADGGDHLTPRQRDKDNARDAALGRTGYLVRRYGWAVAQDGAAVAAELAAIHAERLGKWQLR